MSEKRRMPYAAKGHVETAQARLREADRLIDQELAEEPPKRYEASFATIGRLVGKALSELAEAKRIGYEPANGGVDPRAAEVPAVRPADGGAGHGGG